MRSLNSLSAATLLVLTPRCLSADTMGREIAYGVILACSTTALLLLQARCNQPKRPYQVGWLPLAPDRPFLTQAFAHIDPALLMPAPLSAVISFRRLAADMIQRPFAHMLGFRSFPKLQVFTIVTSSLQLQQRKEILAKHTNAG
jgi:hypothetical protein